MLLNVECKLFFSLVFRCLEKHLISKNKFISKSVQKGCMEKFLMLGIYTRFFLISNSGFCLELRLLNSEIEIGTGVA